MTVPEMVIEGTGSPPRILQALRELWTYRSTIWAFAERDIRVKYKQAVLGIAWAVIQPLFFMIVFSVALGRFAKVPGGGAPYPAFALSALVGWTFLQNSVRTGAEALLSDAALLRKVYFPREVPVLGAIVSSSIDFAVGLALFFILGPFLGARASFTWLLAPFLGILLVIVASGAACALAALNVYYRDFRHAIPFGLQLWLFASPVAYPLEVVPQRWRGLYIAFNPAAGVIDGFRHVLALGKLPDPGLLLASLASGSLIAVLGYRLFKRLEPNFADVV